MEILNDSLPAEHEIRLSRLQQTDWSEHLGFDPTRYGVDVGMGTVDGSHTGIMSACVCAIARNSSWQEQIRAVENQHQTPVDS